MPECVEVVRVRPKEGQKRKLIEEIRPRFLADMKARHSGVVSTVLLESEDGTLLDVVVWESREQAQAALDDGANIPGFVEWGEHCDMVSFEMRDVIERT